MTCTQQDFGRSVVDHEMRVIRDDGVYRHIKFENPVSNIYWFEISTWPGSLCINGGMGAYVFYFVGDMFEFFRKITSDDPSNLRINPARSMRRLQAVSAGRDGSGSAHQFSFNSFLNCVKYQFDEYFESRKISEKRRFDLWAEIKTRVLDHVKDDEGYALELLSDFTSGEFPDLFEGFIDFSCRDYTDSFIWNLYAIAWTIRKYDAAHTVTA